MLSAGAGAVILQASSEHRRPVISLLGGVCYPSCHHRFKRLSPPAGLLALQICERGSPCLCFAFAGPLKPPLRKQKDVSQAVWLRKRLGARSSHPQVLAGSAVPFPSITHCHLL